jgi:hypothetical protein
LGLFLAEQPGRAADADDFYRSQLAAYRGSWLFFGHFRATQTGREADSELAYREAIRTGDRMTVARAHHALASLLVRRQPGREVEVEASFRAAAEAGLFLAPAIWRNSWYIKRAGNATQRKRPEAQSRPWNGRWFVPGTGREV